MIELYVIYDVVVGAVSSMQQAKNIGVATRAFRAYCTETRYPEDLELYRVGVLDEEQGMIVGTERVFVERGVKNEDL